MIGWGTVAPAAEITSTWDGTSGDWSVAGNWANSSGPANYPDNGNGGNDYDVTLANGGTITLDQNISIDSFTLSSGIVTGSFDLDMDANLIWSGGNLEGTGTTSVSGTASTISGNGAVGLDRVLDNLGTMTDSQTGGGYINFDNDDATPGVLNNSGTFNVTGGGDFAESYSTGTDAINNSGVWNVSGAGATSSVGSNIAFNNTGNVNVTSGTLELDGGGTSTGGIFLVSGGAGLNFGGGGGTIYTLGGASSVSGAGTVLFDGGGLMWNFNAGTYSVTGTTWVAAGTANFNSAASTSSLNISGGILGGSGLVSTPSLNWTGGNMEGTGTTSVTGTVSTISGGANVGLDRVLDNLGTMTDSQTGADINLDSDNLTPGFLNNSGTFNVTAGGGFFESYSTGTDAINNSGVWNVSGAGATSTVAGNVAFNNSGSVNVTSGTLELDGGGTCTGGIFLVSGGAGLNFGGGGGTIYTLSGASSVSGLGTVLFEGGGFVWDFNAGTYSVTGTTSVTAGTVNFNSAANTSTLEISNGILGGSGLVSTPSLNWTGGSMEGTGTTSVTGTVSTISGGANVGLDRVLDNLGTMTDSQTGADINLDSDNLTPGVLNNSGTFNVTAGGGFFESYSTGADAINNSGVWNVSGAGATSTVAGNVAFNNTGSVNVTSGTLELDGGGTSTGGIFLVSGGAGLNFGGPGGTIYTLGGASSVSGAGTVLFEGGGLTWDFNAGTYSVTGTTWVSAGTANFNSAASTSSLKISGGALGGSGLVSTPNLNWSGGYMEGTGTTSVTGTVSTISGGANVGLDRVLDNLGTMTDSQTGADINLDNDNLTPGVLNNSGTFNVTAGGGFYESYSTGADAINNSGVWNVSGAGATSTVGSNVAFNNTGSVNVTSGTLELDGGGTSTAGIFLVSAGAGLNFGGGGGDHLYIERRIEREWAWDRALRRRWPDLELQRRHLQRNWNDLGQRRHGQFQQCGKHIIAQDLRRCAWWKRTGEHAQPELERWIHGRDWDDERDGDGVDDQRGCERRVGSCVGQSRDDDRQPNGRRY